MRKTKHFKVYKHGLVYDGNKIAMKQFIVLDHGDGSFQFTNFHKYVSNPNIKVKKFNDSGNNRFAFICKFLNYAFFSAGIRSLSDLTVEIGKEFLNAYGMHELPDDDEDVHRSKDTVKRCVQVILDFYINLTNDKNSGVRIAPDDLYKTIACRDNRGKACNKNVPQFDVVYIPTTKEPIFRDMPNKAFTSLFDHIMNNHKDILGLVMLQAFAGLRPSEACNVRRMDSPLGAGIRMKEINGELYGVEIDLRDELNLRSDLITVGSIKKERTAIVPDIFLSAFQDAYNIYMNYMEDRTYEAEYGAFSINMQGKAITYANYLKKFQDIIQNEIIPMYRQSNDPDLALYADALETRKLSPHVFRHWFTVQLVLSGINEPGMLMKFRGDTSKESALTYINSKGDLEKQFSKITTETFNYTRWAAKKKYEENRRANEGT